MALSRRDRLIVEPGTKCLGSVAQNPVPEGRPKSLSLPKSAKIKSIWDVLRLDEGTLEFGDLETATWPEAKAVGGLN
jgi:hypothetical protein